MHAFTRWIAASMFLFLVCTECSGQSYPDGTLVMSRLKGRFGNFLSRTTGTHYTHTAIVIDGKVCESTFPRAKCTPINRYAAGKPWSVYYVPPTKPLTPRLLMPPIPKRAREQPRLANPPPSCPAIRWP